MKRQEDHIINSGLLADIAFLLLIFFIVITSIDTEFGITKKMSPKLKYDNIVCGRSWRNTLIININKDGVILLNNRDFINISEIKENVKRYLDNGSGKGKNGEFCDYCEGEKSNYSSVHPNRAIVTLQSSRGTKYGNYILATNEILKAYDELRNRESLKLYNQPFNQLLKKAKYNTSNLTLKNKINIVKNRFPIFFTEVEPIKLTN